MASSEERRGADISNRSLRNLFSVELIVWGAGILVTGGIAWGAISENVDAQTERLMEHQTEYKVLEQAVTDITTSVKVIEVRNEDMADDIHELKAAVKANDETAKEVLHLLRQWKAELGRNPPGGG